MTAPDRTTTAPARDGIATGVAPAGRLHVDWTRCDGRGLCWELVPELLEPDDWGFPLSRTGEVAPAVPAGLAGAARAAVAACPRLALRLAAADTPPGPVPPARRSRPGGSSPDR